MKKRKGWLWTLGAAIAFGISTVMTLTSPIYDNMVMWWFPAGLCVLFGALTFWLYKGAKKAEEEYRQKQLAMQEKNRQLEEEIKKEQEKQRELIRQYQERFHHEKFAVAGVTFKNDDGTDRQKILREIALNEDGSCAVWFEENEELGDDSGISVLTENGQVGNIRRSDKKKLRRFFDHDVHTMILSVERFENDEGEKIYRADVVITMDKNDPKQSWYFDDLPES